MSAQYTVIPFSSKKGGRAYRVLADSDTETRDGKKYFDQGPHSKEMQRLNTAFSRMHSFSALTNLVGLGITIWYGFLLAGRLQ